MRTVLSLMLVSLLCTLVACSASMPNAPENGDDANVPNLKTGGEVGIAGYDPPPPPPPPGGGGG